MVNAPGPTRSHPALAATGSTMAVWGGLGSGCGGPLLDGLLYQRLSGAWQPIPPAPLERRLGARIGAVPSGLLVWGGAPESREPHPSPRGAFFRHESQQWEPLTPTGVSIATSALATGIGNRVLLWDGQDEHVDEPIFAGACYDPLTDSWTAVAPCPLPPRFSPAILVVENAMLVVGGYRHRVQSRISFDRLGSAPRSASVPDTGNGDEWSNDCASYDLAANTWRLLPSPSASLAGVRLLWLGNSALGVRVDGTSFLWNPADGACTETATLPVGREGLVSEQGRARIGDSALVLLHAADMLVAWLWTPRDQEWRRLQTPPLGGRRGIAVVGIGNAAIVWGGVSEGSGGRQAHRDGWLVESAVDQDSTVAAS